MLGGDYGSELRDVDDKGLAIGFIDNDGVLFSFDSGEVSMIEAPAGFRYVQGESLSNDGTVIAPAYFLTYVISLDGSGVDQMGSCVQSMPEAVYSIDGRKLGRIAKGLNIVRNSDGSVSKILSR